VACLLARQDESPAARGGDPLAYSRSVAGITFAVTSPSPGVGARVIIRRENVAIVHSNTMRAQYRSACRRRPGARFCGTCASAGERSMRAMSRLPTRSCQFGCGAANIPPSAQFKVCDSQWRAAQSLIQRATMATIFAGAGSCAAFRWSAMLGGSLRGKYPSLCGSRIPDRARARTPVSS
jgi:hypothetical protein